MNKILKWALLLSAVAVLLVLIISVTFWLISYFPNHVMLAVNRNNLMIIRLSNIMGYNLKEIRDEQGVNLLMNSARNCRKEFVEYFLNYGIDVNDQDNDGNTALMYSCCDDIAQVLIDRGALVDLSNKDGNTALCKTTRQELISLLIKNGANVNYQGNGGRTPLMVAAFSGGFSSVDLLLKNNADANLLSKSGKRAIDYAHEGKEVLDFIREDENEREDVDWEKVIDLLEEATSGS